MGGKEASNNGDMAERFMRFAHNEDQVGSTPTITTRNLGQRLLTDERQDGFTAFIIDSVNSFVEPKMLSKYYLVVQRFRIP